MTSRGTRYWSTGAVPLIGPDILGEIIATAADVSLVISPEGHVLSVLRNPANGHLSGAEAWEGQNIRDCITTESIPKIEAQLDAFAAGAENAHLSVEINHIEQAGLDFPIRYTFHPIGPDGTILMLGRDLRPVAEMQEQLVKAQLALERDYEIQREFDTRYRVLMDTTRDAMVFVSLNTGRIADANEAAATLLSTTRDSLVGGAFAQEFEGRRRGEFMETLANTALAESRDPVPLELRRAKRSLLLYPRVFRAAGERLLLCLIEPAGGSDAVSDELTSRLSAFYAEGVDAIAFTDMDGTIISANEAFLNLTDAATLPAVKGKSLGTFLSRGAVDLKVLLDNATRAGQMRMYATKLTSAVGGSLSVEISATHLADKHHPSVVFVLRDASRAEALRKPGVAVTDDSVRSVMEMVGSATLKDIVAETTDVVEKMCIETAVELTRNNRVAAAEMLGLSRQSLYVKLRKYGLLAKDPD